MFYQSEWYKNINFYFNTYLLEFQHLSKPVLLSCCFFVLQSDRLFAAGYLTVCVEKLHSPEYIASRACPIPTSIYSRLVH